jgi:hypothetical protein
MDELPVAGTSNCQVCVSPKAAWAVVLSAMVATAAAAAAIGAKRDGSDDSEVFMMCSCF